uniref:Putative phospholipase n=1 Tax=Superstitionia donensis TaxID=311983 RepID=A0A1V1WBI2_9SCOR
MQNLIFVVTFTLVSVAWAQSSEKELYLNFEPLPGQRDGWPVVRAVRMLYQKRSEGGRELRTFDGCQILDSITEISREAYRMPRHSMKRISKEEMKSFEGRCERSGEVERTFLGTKWCGAGNTSTSYSDLGTLNNIDSCCRDHDHCDSIAAGETKYGLKNKGENSLMNCDCEVAFAACLDEVPSKTYWLLSKATEKVSIPVIKKFYFDWYGNSCYNLTCSSGRSLRNNECAKPVAEYNGPTGFLNPYING